MKKEFGPVLTSDLLCLQGRGDFMFTEFSELEVFGLWE